LILAGCLTCLCHGVAFAQGEWEFLGPDVGYRPDAFFVSSHAIYLGLSQEDETGLGLYRYRFDAGEWELFAWEGYRILGVTVWGESDENILLIRYGPGWHIDVLRSTDSGQTWTVTFEWDGLFQGLTQAESDTARVVIHFPTVYSTNAGWSWNVPSGSLPWNGGYDVSFNTANALVVYLTGMNEFGFDEVYMSTDGGANWDGAFIDGLPKRGIEVEQEQTDHVMCATTGDIVHVTTDDGENWSTLEAPFRTKMLNCPSWSPATFFVVGSDLEQITYEVWRTGDLGETWFPCGDDLPDLPGTFLWRTSMFLEAHPTDPVLYAALEGSGVWRWDVSTSGADDTEASSDPEIRLLLYPNPSIDRFTYGMHLRRPEHVVLTLYDVHGRLLRTLKDGVFPAGTHVFDWRESEGGDQPVTSGIYYLRLDAGETQEKEKIVLLR
jgi:hypothetical protein